MKLSDYFNMKLNGELIWPHLNLMGSGGNILMATQDIEKSILKKVFLRKTVEFYTHLDMEVEFDGRLYSTSLLWDDEHLLKFLYEYLKNNVGNSIKEIGNSEFDSKSVS